VAAVLTHWAGTISNRREEHNLGSTAASLVGPCVSSLHPYVGDAAAWYSWFLKTREQLRLL
jgi:hypothetical protein